MDAALDHVNSNTKKIFFISDVHLGLFPAEKSLEREKILCKWLQKIKPETEELFLVGDIFDFWHEYKKVVPRGFTRFLGTIASFTDEGIPVHFFTGNHDLWTYDYLPKEIGVSINRHPVVRTFNGKKFYIGHGDGLGPGDYWYKMMKSVFVNPISQWIFARFHPNFAMAFGQAWSKNSRFSRNKEVEQYLGDDKEFLVQYAKEVLKKEYFDYLLFGHRHLPLKVDFSNGSQLLYLGDWINHFSYAVFDGAQLRLQSILSEEDFTIVHRNITV
jgi:UDP-2,3-diacylglucosamine hydrolase